MPRALITGITGQDGLYLGELLAKKVYDVFGLVRGQRNPKIAVVEGLIPSIELLEGDLTDLRALSLLWRSRSHRRCTTSARSAS